MPSDAYMDISPPDIVGEAGDHSYGEKTGWGGFEIFSVSFHTGDTDMVTTTSNDGKKTTTPVQKNQKTANTNDSNTPKGKVSVEKPIDKSSPYLFRYCCEKKPIPWAVIFIREAGEETSDGQTAKPWLRLEFQKCHVTNFTWDIDPGAGGDEVNKSEKLELEFEKMYVSYMRQDVTGVHADAVTSENGWNFADNDDDVSSLFS